MKELNKEFFSKETLEIAKNLIGKVIEVNNFKARIIEVEAYKQDEASHAFTKTSRSQLMYETYGHVYVYLIYGIYYCLNFTTEKNGVGAVLIRALEPLNVTDKKLYSGPGKLCKALGINKTYNGSKIGEKIKIYDDGTKFEIKNSKRIGITKAKDLEWRFYISRQESKLI